MSGTEADTPEMLAGEYVLGTLDTAEAESVRARLALDRVLAAEVRFWESRLLPLTDTVPSVPPPASLWTRIEDSTGGSATMTAAPASRPAANDNRAGFWRATALGALAVAASLAAFVVLRPPPAPPAFAVLVPTGSTATVLVALAGPNGTLVLRPSGAIAVAANRDLQLWALAAGATRPASLGVLPPGGKQIPPSVAPGTQLLISLEPKGGSPTGQPTGPVIYGGRLTPL